MMGEYSKFGLVAIIGCCGLLYIACGFWANSPQLMFIGLVMLAIGGFISLAKV